MNNLVAINGAGYLTLAAVTWLAARRNIKENTMTNQQKSMFYRCYYGFFINGMVVLLIGAILPHLIQAAGLSYGMAGGLLSSMAIGNLCASFLYPSLSERIGRKITVVLLAAFFPICLTAITFLPPVPVLYICFFLMGIGRGTVSIFNNSIINDYGDGTPAALNILHTFFALGAFLAPFLTSSMIELSFSWRQILYVIVVWYLTSLVSFATMPLKENSQIKKPRKQDDVSSSSYLKSFRFYCMGLVLFFYMGVENCVNGWFVTYLQDIGVMSDSYATNLVSITWIVIMIGRIVCAWLSGRISKRVLLLINCIGSALALFLLISNQNIVIITIAMALIGFFLAGIYPTSIASAGSLLKGTSSGMAILMAMSALGGIIAPQIVGWIADSAGIAGGISFLVIDAVIMVGFAILNYWQEYFAGNYKIN